MASPARILLSLLFLFLYSSLVAGTTSAEPAVIPDLTKVVPENSQNNYLLGPIGIRGWMYIKTSKQGPQDMSTHYSTAKARQILVTKVEKQSPADGVLDVGDVILGVGGEPFSSDPRKALAAAIDEAEKTENEGKLTLLRWRPDEPDAEDATERSAGKTEMVTLTLKTFGSYADTAPYDCPKSTALLEQSVEALYREGVRGKLGLPQIALMATGDPKDLVQAKNGLSGGKVPEGVPSLEAVNKGHSWNLGYGIIAKCEYYFLTRDETVLPGIRYDAQRLAMGQSNSGVWGHYMAAPKWNDNQLHGRLEGYGALNQPSLTCLMALEMARKCGVDDPEVNRAVKKCNTYFAYYIDKGGVPYGFREPKEFLLTDNGTAATAAITFALNGNKRGAEFFSKMCAASHGKLDVGHTGIFLNLMWTKLGAAVGGPELCAAYAKEWRWYMTLCRKWNGGFAYQSPGGGGNSYRGLSMTAAMILHYSLPRRKLIITGKEPEKSIWADHDAAKAIVDSWFITYDKATPEELLELLGHDIPLVRRHAASELAKRKSDVVPQLVSLLKEGSRSQRVGACHGLGALKETSATAVDELMGVVENPKEEQWLRIRAAHALSGIGEPARKYVPEMLRLILAEKPEDERRRLELHLGQVVRGLTAKPFPETADKKLLYDAAMKLIKHPHADARWHGMALIHDIPLEDFHLFADDIVHVILNKDTSYTTYHSDQARKVGLMILERLNIKEGIELALNTIIEGWGVRWRLAGPYGRLEMVKKYGASAKSYLPKIKEMKLKEVPDVVKAIEESTVERKLISLEEAKAVGKAGKK